MRPEFEHLTDCRPPWRTLLLGLCCLLISSATQAAIVHETTPDSEYLAEGANHPWVGFMEGADSSGVKTFQQSGVLIHPNWVITTVHGLLEVDNDKNSLLTNLSFGFGSNYLTDRQQVQGVAEVFLHPGYDDLGNGYDQALLRFGDPFENVPPAERFVGDIAALATGRPDMFHAGYGLTGTFGSELVADGNKRGGVSARMINGNIRVTGDFQSSIFDPRVGSFGYRELGIGNELGDSGGFYGIKNESGYQLTAVNALILKGSLTHSNIGSTLDNSWIDEVIANNTTAIPEPGIFSLLALGTTAYTLGTRRKRIGG